MFDSIKMNPQDIIIGIDLGTTNSCAAVFRNGQVEIIPNDQGNRTTPSIVAFDENERFIGDAAKNQMSYNPNNTIYGIKRIIGRLYNEPEVQEDIKTWPFTIINENNLPKIQATYKNEIKTFTPELISSMVLTKMKEISETYLGHEITKAVVTVPAYFNDKQRRATIDAGNIAGLNIIRIINEPTAASLAYGLNKEGERLVLIFDYGGGTFDVTLLKIDDGIFTVKATSGNVHLGGEDIDNCLVTWCLKEFTSKNKLENTNFSLKSNSRLRFACEKAKKFLSSAGNAIIEVDSFHEGKDLRLQLTKSRFENLCAEEFNKCFLSVDQVLKDANITKNEVSDIVLVGGSTRIPKIREMLKEYFKKELKHDINPDEAVAYGAAIQGAILSNVDNETINKLVLIDVTPLSIGIETAGGIMSKIINRNETIPCSKKQTFSTYSDNQPSVTIHIYEGEREFTKFNNLLGTFELTGLPPAPRGQPKIIVKLDLDTNGILNVTATEESTNKSNKIIIKNDKNRISPDQLQKMIHDAKLFEQEDQKRKEDTQSKNEFEMYIYNNKNYVNNLELKNKLSDQEQISLNNIFTAELEWFSSDSYSSDCYKERQKQFQNLISPYFMKMYT